MDETFTLLPITIDPQSKALSAPSLPTLTPDLTALTTLHRTLLSLPEESKTTPPPPLPVAPKRSAQVQKMREGGNASLRKATPVSPPHPFLWQSLPLKNSKYPFRATTSLPFTAPPLHNPPSPSISEHLR